jgi:hypothetical protein
MLVTLDFYKSVRDISEFLILSFTSHAVLLITAAGILKSVVLLFGILQETLLQKFAQHLSKISLAVHLMALDYTLLVPVALTLRHLASSTILS